MAMMHILDATNARVIGTLDSEFGDFAHARISRSTNQLQTLDFTAYRHTDLLQGLNRIVIRSVSGIWEEYTIRGREDLGDAVLIQADGSFVEDLRKAAPHPPQTLRGETPYTAMQQALSPSNLWKAGRAGWSGEVQDLTLTDYTDPYDFLLNIAEVFGLKLRFRVEIRDNEIAGRYVDLVNDLEDFKGHEIEFGRNLLGIRRKEDAQSLVTALVVVGPDPQDGEPIVLTVEDHAARDRWGLNGQHLWAVYKPDLPDEEPTEFQLRRAGEAELKRRINALVQYEVDALSFPDMRLGTIVRIKDEHYNPPLYLEAEVREQEEDPILGDIMSFKIGDFIQFSQEELLGQIRELRELLKRAADRAVVEGELAGIIEDLGKKEDAIPEGKNPPPNPEYRQKWVDTSMQPAVLRVWAGDAWIKVGATEASEIGAETPEGAQDKADNAADDAKKHADDQDAAVQAALEKYAREQAAEAERKAKEAAALDAQQRVDATYQTTITEAESLANAARDAAIQDAEGKLATARQALEQAIGKVDEDAAQAAADAQAAAIADAEGKLATARQELETAISTEAGAARDAAIQDAEGKLSTARQELEAAIGSARDAAIADAEGKIATAQQTLEQAIGKKADANAVYTITEVDEALRGKVSTTTYTTDQNGIIERLGTAETEISQNAEAIRSKAEQTDLDAVFGVASSAKTTAEQTAESLKSKAEAETVNLLTGRVETAETTIEQHAGFISSKAEKTDLDAVSGVASSAKTTAEQTAEALLSKAEQEDLDTVSGVASSAKTTAEQTAQALLSKAETTYVDTVKGTAESAKTTAEQTAKALTSKAEKETVNAIDGRVSKAETTIEQHAGLISSKAEQEDLDTVSGVASSAKTTAEQTALALTSKAEKEDLDTVSGIASSAKTTAEQTAESLKTKAEVTYVNTKADEVQKYVQSRGENLVTNGLGMLGDNTNFSNAQFDGTTLSIGKGSFTRSGRNGSIAVDELIPFDINKSYRLMFYIKTEEGRSTFLPRLNFYDVDGRVISRFHTAQPGYVRTTLTRELKTGDTEIHVGDASQFRNDNVAAHYRVIQFWGYQSDSGYTYPTYTRYAYQNLWDPGNVDVENGIIRLRNPWPASYPNFEAGREVSSAVGGDSYSMQDGYIKTSPEWQLYNKVFDKTGNITGPGPLNDAVALVKIAILTDRSLPEGTTERTWLNGVQFFNLDQEQSAKGYTDAQVGPVQQTVSKHSTELEQTAKALRSKAEQEDLDTVSGIASSAKTTAEQTAQALTSKAETETVNAIEGRVGTAETTLEQHATAISSKAEKKDLDTVSGVANTAKTTAEQTALALTTKAETEYVDTVKGTAESAKSTAEQTAEALTNKVEKTDFNALTGRVETAEGSITTMAGQISAKASSESVETLEGRVDDVEGAVETTEMRLSEAELRIEDSSITSTVLNSTQFESMFSTKANADDLAGYATADAVENLTNTVDGLNEEFHGFRSQEYVTQTEIEQRDLSILTSISASSGVNLLRNSVGLAGLEHWNVTGGGTVSPTGSNELTALGYHSGFLLEGAATGNTTLSQDVPVLAGKAYTLSFALRNVNKTGNIMVRVVDAARNTVIATAPVYSEAAAATYGSVSVLVESAPSAQLRVEIVIPANKNAIITAVMLNIGRVPFSWTTAVGELYNTTIKMDLNGMRVSQHDDSGVETGFTVMTPSKFAGYYNESGFINENTGSEDEVFRVDRDEFVMKKATVSSEITMGTFKIVPINTAARKGWAFVPN